MQPVAQGAELVRPRILDFHRKADEVVRGVRGIEVEREQRDALPAIELERQPAGRFLPLEDIHR